MNDNSTVTKEFVDFVDNSSGACSTDTTACTRSRSQLHEYEEEDGEEDEEEDAEEARAGKEEEEKRSSARARAAGRIAQPTRLASLRREKVLLKPPKQGR